MPLREGASREVIGANIASLIREGKTQKQAVAIALGKAREFEASGGRSSGVLVVIRRGGREVGWSKYEGSARSPERIVRGLLEGAARAFASGDETPLRQLAGARVSVEKAGVVRAMYEVRFAGGQLAATPIEG